MPFLVLNTQDRRVKSFDTVSVWFYLHNVHGGSGRLLHVLQRDVSGGVGFHPDRGDVVLGQTAVELVILASPAVELVGEPVDLIELGTGDGEGSSSHLWVGKIVSELIKTGNPEKEYDDILLIDK